MSNNRRIPIVLQGDCLRVHAAQPRKCDLIITDPPYNIGVDYGLGEDRDQKDPDEYRAWCHEWISLCGELLAPNGTLWLVINDEWAAEYVTIAKQIGLTMRNWVKWYETFGVNCTRKFNRTSRHCLYFVKHPGRFTFNPDPIRVPSARLEKYNDARANPAGKLPDDVWSIPRICGTHAERIPDVPTQLPEALVERMILACSNEGDLVYDPFTGSGTVLAVAARLGRRVAGTEISKDYCRIADQRIAASKAAWAKQIQARESIA